MNRSQGAVEIARTPEPAYEVRVRRVRRLAAKHGLVLRSSRVRNINTVNHGACWLQDGRTGFVVVGNPECSRLYVLEDALAEMAAAL